MKTEANAIETNSEERQTQSSTPRRKDAKAQRNKRSCIASLRLCAFALILLPPGLSAATNDLTGALQRGLFEEEANHNLEAAAQAYQAVSTQFDKDRKLAATAIFRLGEVYRKQGKTNEAVAHYERIVREFSDQETLATLSRQNLAGLGKVETPQASATAGDILASLQNQYQLLKLQLETAKNSQDPYAPARLFDDEKLKQALDQNRQLMAVGESEEKQKQALERVNLIMAALFKEKERQLTNLESAIQRARAGQPAQLPAGGERGNAATTDDEEKEIRRIQAIVKDSPDLINAKEPTAGTTLLHAAAANGQLTVAQFLLANGANVDAKDSQYSGRTPLHYAARAGRKAMVELLLDHKADPQASDSSGYTALHAAAEHGFKAVVEVLLVRGADVNARTQPGTTPLHLAVLNGHKSVTETLLNAKADPNASESELLQPIGGSGRFAGTALHIAIGRGDRAMFDMLLAHDANVNQQDHSGDTPLHVAINREEPALLELLLVKSADVNITNNRGTAPLLAAVDRGQPQVVKQLLAHHADPEIAGRVRNGPNEVGSYPLRRAIDQARPEIVQLLLEHGTDVNSWRDCFGTRHDPPIFGTLDPSRTNILGLLLQFKADPNTTNLAGQTPLYLSAILGHLGAAQLLLSKGADANASDKNGYTPLLAAVINSRPEMVILLLGHKADPNATGPAATFSGGSWGEDRSLNFAMYVGSDEILESLLDSGADPNALARRRLGPYSDIELPIWTAVRTRRTKSVELLLAHGAKPNVQQLDGYTPLHWAVESRHKEICELLLAKGADPNIQNQQGRTPLDMIKSLAQSPPTGAVATAGPVPPAGLLYTPARAEEIVALLRQHGALDDLPDFSSIRVTRAGLPLPIVVFKKDTNAINRFTVLEAMRNYYPQPAYKYKSTGPGLVSPIQYQSNPTQLPFPDFSRITVARRTGTKAGEQKKIDVNVLGGTNGFDHTKDVALEFGDVVEIREREHALSESAVGLTDNQDQQLVECLARKVTFVIKGQPNEVSIQGRSDAAYLSSALQQEVVRTILRSSSDLSRIKVKRTDPATKETKGFSVNAQEFLDAKKPRQDDLWLRDGDVIEVPDKP